MAAGACSTLEGAGPFLEFGLCGVDRSVEVEDWRKAFGEAQGEAGKDLRLVAAFQLAYQGFPWQPTPAYEEGAPFEGRRYDGLVYPAWSEVNAYKRDLPKGTPFSFHLNETSKCPYVSGLLRGDADYLRLVEVLVKEYGARHVQVNLNSYGVPTALFDGESDESGKAVAVLRQLCADFKDTIFIVPLTQVKKSEGESVSTLPFVKQLLAEPVPTNICGFFDASAGSGKEPDVAPEIPEWYPSGPQHFVGFTGGIHAGNVKVWLDRYAARARERGCRLISDAQSGFRKERNRGKPVDREALLGLSAAVREWAGL